MCECVCVCVCVCVYACEKVTVLQQFHNRMGQMYACECVCMHVCVCLLVSRVYNRVCMSPKMFEK